MFFVYSLLLGLGFIILLPRFAIDALRHGKYVAGFRERLGLLAPINHQNQPLIWVHCVSVGETQAARPLIKRLRAEYPRHRLVVSTITTTGQTMANELFENDVELVFYFPFDWGWVARRTLKAVNPTAVLLMETEIWPGFLRECQRRQVPVAIVNGRLSDQSFRRYRLIRRFMKRVLKFIDTAIMQTEADAHRLINLGMGADRTFVAGNIKYDAGALPSNAVFTVEFRQRFGLGSGQPAILAASTHTREELVLLEAYRRVRQSTLVRPKLIIVPRHPERFAEVALLIKASGFRWARRSDKPSGSDAESDVILVDSIGELQSLYPLASIVFVGGSIARAGGHNILEPAAVGACVITGPHTHNFRRIVETFVEAEALIQLPNIGETGITDELARILSNLLADEPRCRQLGKRAEKLVKQNLGAADRSLQLLKPLLASNRSTATKSHPEPPLQDVPAA